MVFRVCNDTARPISAPYSGNRFSRFAQGAKNDEDTLGGCRAGLWSRYRCQRGDHPAPVGKTDSLVIKAAEGCGPGFWRGPHGRCHPMFDGRACPPGYHLGPERKRCWPNE
jgi:hypothetical protein